MESALSDRQPQAWLRSGRAAEKSERVRDLLYTQKRLFAIKGLNPQGKKKLETIILHREVETEETSLKFSNLSADELLFGARAAKPSSAIRALFLVGFGQMVDAPSRR